MQHHHDADEPTAKPPLDYAAERYRGYSAAASHLEPLFVSIPETSRLTGLSTVTIYRLIANERLVCIKAGTKSLVEMASIKNYLASLPRFVGKTGKAA